jgi:hypothetical protein
VGVRVAMSLTWSAIAGERRWRSLILGDASLAAAGLDAMCCAAVPIGAVVLLLLVGAGAERSPILALARLSHPAPGSGTLAHTGDLLWQLTAVHNSLGGVTQTAWRMASASFSAAATTVQWRLARGLVGKTAASATRRPASPCTRPAWSTTAPGSSAGPIRQVLQG